jgi:FADH2 O2-dependent halogenase
MEVEFKDRVLEGVKQNHTYHVNREKFDHLLLNHSIELGCSVFENHKVSEVDINKKNVSVTVADNRKNKFHIQSNIIVDASGRNTFLGKKYKWKIKDPVFNQFAVHTWFKNYDRIDAENLNTTIHFLPIANSWIWQIPIDEDITSIGIVAQKEYFVGKKDLVEDYFWDTIKTRPDIYKKLLKAEKIRDLITEGDYSYSMKELTHDRVLLVGDAARFVDPIFASGVSIAMQSAKFASKDIIEAIKNKKFDNSQFNNYKNLLSIGCKNWHEFITLYYRLNVMFTYFLGKDEYRYDILKFLQGDVYDDKNPKLLQVMRKFVEGVENNPKHPLHDYLGDLTANKFST